jgi:hypothetical protein
MSSSDSHFLRDPNKVVTSIVGEKLDEKEA